VKSVAKIAAPFMSSVRQTYTEMADTISWWVRNLAWGLAMPAYRFFLLGTDGHVNRPAPITECPDDESAILQAKQVLERRAIEIWNFERFVTRLDPEGDHARRQP
jgi:hypothetical protein